MTDHPLKSWPPAVSDEQLESLTLQATTYALSHGLVYRPVAKVQPVVPTSTIHAPLALFPSPIPRTLFNRARQLQHTYNTLYARVATDVAFLDKVMGAEVGVGKADEFTGELWKRWRRVRDEGIAQVRAIHLFSIARTKRINVDRHSLLCSRFSLDCSGRIIWSTCRTLMGFQR